MSVKGATALAKKLDRWGRSELHKTNVLSVEAACRTVEKDVKGRRFSGDPIHVRSGITRASIRTQLDRGRNPNGTVGSPIKHIGVLEDGKTITPKTKQYLTIPLRAALTASGKSRGNARTVAAAFPHSFIRKSKRGKLILFGKRGDTLTPLFVLVKKVRIPAFHPFQKAANATRLGVVRRFETDIAKMLAR